MNKRQALWDNKVYTDILEGIKHKKNASEIARFLNKAQSVVARQIKYLELCGLICFSGEKKQYNLKEIYFTEKGKAFVNYLFDYQLAKSKINLQRSRLKQLCEVTTDGLPPTAKAAGIRPTII